MGDFLTVGQLRKHLKDFRDEDAVVIGCETTCGIERNPVRVREIPSYSGAHYVNHVPEHKAKIHALEFTRMRQLSDGSWEEGII